VKDLRWKAVTEAKHLQTILALSQSVEAKDPYTRGHSVRVADLAAWIAQRIPQLDEQTVHRCGLIHDVGKLAIPDTILLKNSRLTDEEYEIMKSHTLEGAKLCENLDIPTEIILGVKHHHERWDGLGYPLGLQGENISLIGRVLCVADAIDAMCSDRAYRHALDMRAVQEQLRTGANKQFDPVLIKLVLAGWKDFEKYYGTHA
jgi:putative nucleotidyltransferase with HDIG domain